MKISDKSNKSTMELCFKLSCGSDKPMFYSESYKTNGYLGIYKFESIFCFLK